MNPFFSIIIATYNSEKYLHRTLESVINQHFKDYEIIIVDGGSVDATLQIVEKYNESISIVISEKDEGIYDAWNKGINAAKGQWITFLGSDDIFLSGALIAYYDFVQNTDIVNLDYVSSKVNLVTLESKTLRTIGRPWDWRVFRKFMCVAHVGSIHHASLYQRYGAYDISYKITGDYEFLLRPRQNLKAGFLDKITAGMQVGGVSMNFSVYKETYRAKINTGNVPKIIAIYDWIVAVAIFFGRKILKY